MLYPVLHIAALSYCMQAKNILSRLQTQTGFWGIFSCNKVTLAFKIVTFHSQRLCHVFIRYFGDETLFKS